MKQLRLVKDCLQIWLLIIYLNNLSFIYEIRVKNMVDEWRKEREEYENKIRNLESLLEIQNNLDN